HAAGAPRAHLVGNSMGASVALAAAVSHPEVVDRLVLMGDTDVRFPITEGLERTWGYTPSVANMRRLLDVFAYDRGLASDELAEPGPVREGHRLSRWPRLYRTTAALQGGPRDERLRPALQGGAPVYQTSDLERDRGHLLRARPPRGSAGARRGAAARSHRWPR